MRTELANWTARQSKHAAVAYPLITYLICMEEDNTFSQYVDTLVDNLHRQLKASNYAHVVTHTYQQHIQFVTACCYTMRAINSQHSSFYGRREL